MPAPPATLCERVKLLLNMARSGTPRAVDAWRHALLRDADLGWALARADETAVAIRVRLAVWRQHGAPPRNLGARTAGALRWLGVAPVVERRP